MSNPVTERLLDEAASRNAIQNCLARYCRGIDRRDRAMLELVYWPDATDDHVSFTGSGGAFIDWVLPLLDGIEATQHFLGQSLIDQQGDVAAVETYVQAYHRMMLPSGLSDVFLGGRYVDRFERRDGEWRIAYRRVMGDWHHNRPSDGGLESFPLGPFSHPNGGVAGPTDNSFTLLGGEWPL